MAVGYTLTGGGTTDPAIVLALSLQLDRYAVSPELTVDRAISNAAADRAAYERIHNELAQPDVRFTLTTTLEHADGGEAVSHALDVAMFRSFVLSARIVLDAICATLTDDGSDRAIDPGVSGALNLDMPISVETTVQVAASFAAPVVPLGVTVTERHAPDAAATAVEVLPHIACDDPFAFDTFAATVETALPGVMLATGELAGENDDPAGRRLWLVNFGSPRGPAISFSFEPAPEVRSFAIPPLSTSLVSGSVTVPSYVPGSGLSGAPRTLVFAGIDLDVWAPAFLDAIDLVLSPAYAAPAQDSSRVDFERIVSAKRALVTSIAARVQYVLAGGGPDELGSPDPRRDAAIAAMERSLCVALANAYTIASVVLAAGDVTVPDTTTAAPALMSFLLTVQAPESERSATAAIEYEVVAVEHSSTWLALVHRLAPVRIDGVTLPIPLRAYPRAPAPAAQDATASFPEPAGADELVRWDASAAWTYQAAEQDTIALQVELGTANPDAQATTLGASSTRAIFAALAQFETVWPEVSADLALLTSRAPGAAPDPITSGAVAALATMAAAVAAAWPADASVPPALAMREVATAEIVPGSYGYTLVHPRDESAELSTVTVVAAPVNPGTLWPELAVDDGTGMRALTLQSSTPAQAVYAYPSGFLKGATLTYQATLPKLDLVTVATAALSAAVARNERLVDGAATSPPFVYRTPYTGFPAPLVPRLRIDQNVDIGNGSMNELEAALQAFFRDLLGRPDAPAGSQRALRIAVSYGYELSAVDRAAAAADGPVTTVPITLVPSVLLTISGDDDRSLDAFAHDLAGVTVAWHAQANPSPANAAVFFDVSVFAENADPRDEPLLVARSVRYNLS
jgi:hypothetical protein